MANYIGIEPRSSNGLRDYFTGTGSQTSYTLTYTPGGANGIIVAISGLLQKPGVAYFVSGKTLTFSEAPPIPAAGETNNIEVIYLQKMGSAQNSSWKFPVADNTGTTDALVAAYAPIFSGLTDNILAGVVLSAPNATTTPTFSPDGLPAKTIVDFDGSALPIGKLQGTIFLRYESGTDKWVLAGSVGNGSTTARGTLSGATPTPDVKSYSSFTWTLNANSTLGYPASVPQSGAWYIDITVDATGGYTLSFAAGYNKVYGYYFDCLPNAIYRLWMTARGSAIIDVNIERIL